MGNNNEVRIETNENISKGEKIRTYCIKCEREVNHQVLMDYFERIEKVIDYGYDFSGKRDYATIDSTGDYQIIKCFGCDEISYRSFKYFSEYDEPGTWEERYPIPEKRKIKEYDSLPSTLEKIYEEVIMTYNNDGFILCAGGIRAILEGICKDKGITDNTLLYQKIKKLYEQGFVTQQQENILHDLRFLGNDALHELQKPTLKEIDAAIDITEHIIESLYGILEKAKKLKRRKKLI